MPKQTDITGTFRIPEEAWGRFWNTMRSIPGAEITPGLDATPNGGASTSKRTHGKQAEGSTTKCLMLRLLMASGGAVPTSELTKHIVSHGKSHKSTGSALDQLLKTKRVKRTAKGYTITAAGRDHVKTHCNANKE